MKKLLLLCLCIYSNLLFAQNSAYFNFAYGTSFSEVIATSDGGYFAVGKNGSNGMVLKLSANFNVQWAKAVTNLINGTTPRACIESKNGNYYIIFNTLGSTTITRLHLY